MAGKVQVVFIVILGRGDPEILPDSSQFRKGND